MHDGGDPDLDASFYCEGISFQTKKFWKTPEGFSYSDLGTGTAYGGGGGLLVGRLGGSGGSTTRRPDPFTVAAEPEPCKEL